jgi:hypothetical protein
MKTFEQFNEIDPYDEEDWNDVKLDYINYKGTLRDFLETLSDASPYIKQGLKFYDARQNFTDIINFIMSGLRDLGMDMDNRNKIYQELYEFRRSHVLMKLLNK